MSGKRASNFLLGKVAIDGSVTVGALPAGNNNIGDVDVASIAAGTNSIGSVDVNGPTSVFDVAQKTDLSNATPFQLGNNSGLKIGIKITNQETTVGNIIYVGSSSVSATRYITAIYPGQTSEWLPCSNSNAYYVIAATNNSDFTYGGA